jgi:hypothetical protein
VTEQFRVDDYDLEYADDATPPGQAADQGVSLDDFYAYMLQHNYIFAPSGEMWPSSSVNARIPPVPLFDNDGKPVLDKRGQQVTVSATAWLDKHRPVEQTTWTPGEPNLVNNRLISEGGWIERPGCRVFNLYRPPTVAPGDPTKAGPWLDHVRRVYPEEADHIVHWLAHRVQRPHDKINHALVLGGLQGIGKDTLLEPVKRAIGPWNFREASPQQVLGRFNSFLKSVILRVNEARDLGDVDRFGFYDHMKAYTAAPPDVLRVDEKHIHEHYILNVVGVIITSNHKADGIHLPADDRRHFVAWSSLTKNDFPPGYWRNLYRWYADGGNEHVAAYLGRINLSDFDAKAPPPKTAAFYEIVDAGRAPEDSELADALDALGTPDTVIIDQVAAQAEPAFAEWLRDRKNARRIPHRFEECGYVAVRNPTDAEGRWKISGRRHTIYAKDTLTQHDRLAAAYRRTGAR